MLTTNLTILLSIQQLTYFEETAKHFLPVKNLLHEKSKLYFINGIYFICSCQNYDFGSHYWQYLKVLTQLTVPLFPYFVLPNSESYHKI